MADTPSSRVILPAPKNPTVKTKQGKDPSKAFPIVNTGSSVAIQRSSPHVELAKLNPPVVSTNAGNSAEEAKLTQRHDRRGRSRGRSSSTPFRPAAIEVGTSSIPKEIQGPISRRSRGKGAASPKSPPRVSKLLQTQRSWAAAAKSAEKGYTLSYIPPTMIGGKPVVIITEEILAHCNPKWMECIVGYHVGKKLPFKLTEKAIKNVWGTHVVDVLANEDGFLFFHIPDEAVRRKIVDDGPITILGVPMILQQWHPTLKLEKNQHQ